MGVDGDLRAIMLRCLEIEKHAVQDDLDDYGCSIVILITPGGRFCEYVEFDDEGSKIAAYAAVVEKAKEERATVIITVNAARISRERWTTDDLDGYWWGKLAAEDARDRISITASGPGMKSFGLDLGYDIVGGKVQFDPDPEFAETEVGMLPDWPPTRPSLVS